MTALSFFGRPEKSFKAGGAHIAIYAVPVYDGKLVVYDIDASGITGRFLPWTVLAFGGNPYADASLLVDDWCQVPVSSLRLIDVIGGHQAEGSRELAIVFRAELFEPPRGDAHREPVLLDASDLEPIGPFPVTELQRWLAAGTPPAPAAPEPANPPERPVDDDSPRLLF